MTFRQWLKQQRYRDDPIGDLARHFADDKCAKGLRSVRSIRRHILFAHNAGPAVAAALAQAIHEYVELVSGEQ
jgi:hypothetical protein